MSLVENHSLALPPRISEAGVGDYIELLKPRVMSLVVFTALVGLLMTLNWLVGPGWATLIVVGGGVLVTVIIGWGAWLLIKKATEIKDKDERP